MSQLTSERVSGSVSMEAAMFTTDQGHVLVSVICHVEVAGTRCFDSQSIRESTTRNITEIQNFAREYSLCLYRLCLCVVKIVTAYKHRLKGEPLQDILNNWYIYSCDKDFGKMKHHGRKIFEDYMANWQMISLCPRASSTRKLLHSYFWRLSINAVSLL